MHKEVTENMDPGFLLKCVTGGKEVTLKHRKFCLDIRGIFNAYSAGTGLGEARNVLLWSLSGLAGQSPKQPGQNSVLTMV